MPLLRAERRALLPPPLPRDYLTAYWRMEGASGAAEPDECGVSPLASTNTVGSGAGKAGNARTFVAASQQQLSVADNPRLRAASLFWVGGWARSDLDATVQTLLGKGTGTAAATSEYRISRAVGNTISAVVSDGATAHSTPNIAVVTGAWFRFDLVYDGATIGLSVNGGALQKTAHTTGIQTGTGGAFRVGVSPAGNTNYWEGAVDEVLIVKRYLPSPGLLAWLAAAGRSYRDLRDYTG